jgi:hypothetical protein
MRMPHAARKARTRTRTATPLAFARMHATTLPT